MHKLDYAKPKKTSSLTDQLWPLAQKLYAIKFGSNLDQKLKTKSQIR